jgi:hypothetical protein
LVTNTSTSLQTTLGSEAKLTERQFLLEEPSLNMENSPVYGAGARRSEAFQTEEQNFELE